jgi:peroxiredoxin
MGWVAAAVLGTGVALAGWLGAGAAAPQEATVVNGRRAPAWKLRDPDGKVVDSASFKGKVVVIDFWATWCPPCREEIPGYVELMRKHGAEGLVVVGVSLDQGGPAVVKAFAAKAGINYPLAMADDEIIAAFGGVEAIPTTFLIDREGIVRDRKVGAEPAAEYAKKVQALLAKKTG